MQNSSDNLIDRYQIVKTLGQGSFGKVKLAYHLATNSKVALKIINRSTLVKTDMQGRVEREISYLRLLRHRHIIKLYEVIKNKQEIIMVMEFAGKELFDHIVQQGRLQEDEARKYFQQIISAVQYCHRHKIVHRDLKPENLLLDEHMDIKIADFGLSNIMTDGNFLKTSCGSPNYAAPEVISGRLYAGPEVDVWSCGVILYVMLVGRLPFDEESIPDLFYRISNAIYTIPDFVSPGARHLLKRMLVVNPLDRIIVDQIIQDSWFKKNLPIDLFPDISNDEDDGEIDEGVVNYLSEQLGYSKDDLVKIMQNRLSGVDAANVEEIKDAYRLAKDSMNSDNVSSLDEYMNRKSIEIREHEKSRKHHGNGDPSHSQHLSNIAIQKHGIPSAYPFDSTHLGPQGNSVDSTISILPQSLTPYHLAFMQKRGVEITKKRSPVTAKKSKIRWHFGIRSRSYPLDVMGEIYHALKTLGAEWLPPTTDDIWTIYVRWKKITDPANGRPAIKETVKMRIQLYQLEQNNYLVDFKFDGFENDNESKHDVDDTFSSYPFLRMATRLIMELAVNSQS